MDIGRLRLAVAAQCLAADLGGMAFATTNRFAGLFAFQGFTWASEVSSEAHKGDRSTRTRGRSTGPRSPEVLPGSTISTFAHPSESRSPHTPQDKDHSRARCIKSLATAAVLTRRSRQRPLYRICTSPIGSTLMTSLAIRPEKRPFSTMPI